MSQYSEKLSIDTPENILLDAEIAGFGTRCIAAILDYLTLLTLLIAMTYGFARATSDMSAEESGPVWAIYALVQFALFIFYHLFFEFIWNGQTPGKRRVGIRVVQVNGLPATTSGLLIRNLVRVFDFLPFFYGFGLIILFASKNTQRLGDLAARTIVIRERKDLKLHTLQEDFKVQYIHIRTIEPLPAYIQIHNLTQEDRRRVVNYLQRRHEFRDRDQVAQLLAKQIARKAEDPTLEKDLAFNPRRSELYLEHVARAFEIAERTGE